MTLAVPEPQDPRTADTDSWIPVLADVAQLATRIAETDFVPKGLRGSIPAVAAAILYGREVGLPPMTALTQTHVIEGKPAMSAEAMRAMVLAAGHDLITDETTGALCTMRARRRGTEHWTPLTWTIDMARAAGVANKNVWKSYPRQMLQARCTTELVRLVFPDVIHGFRSVEELEDMGDEGPTFPTTTTATTTKVTRKRADKKPAALASGGQVGTMTDPYRGRPPSVGPPLPGEEGYQETPSPTLAGDGSSVGSEGEGEAPEEPTDTPDSPGSSPGVEAQGGEQSGDDTEAVVGTSDSPPERRGPRKASRSQTRMIFALLSGLDVTPDDALGGREERLHITSRIVGRDIASFDDLLSADAKTLIETLGRLKDRPALNDLLDAIDAQANQEENTDG